MKFRILFFVAFISSLSFSQSTGTISGTIKDKNANNQPLAFANIILKNTSIATNADVDGKYTLKVAAGNYTIVFSFIGYENIEENVTVVAGETVNISKTLGSGNYTLQDVVVKAAMVNREKETAILLDQKKSIEIKQSIGAQEMSRKGVSNVESGLTKITGITKVDGRGLFVRGLEDRYNNLLINDLAAPTNNPYKKIIPLDLFPTDIVGVIDVYKTFNPDIYGDFAGGTFNIATSKVVKSVTKLSIGAGFVTNNNLEKFLLAKDADNIKGFIGLNSPDRALPSILGGKPASYTFTPNQALESFKSGFDVVDTRSPLNTSIGILHSEKFNLKNNYKFSYLLSLNFDNSYSIKKGVERTFANNETGFIYKNDFENSEFKYKNSVSSLLSLNFNTSRLKLTWNNIYLKTTENLIKDQFGFADLTANNNVTLIRTNQLDQSIYFNTQLLGDLGLTVNKNQSIKFGGSFAKTRYQQPDRKFFSGTRDGSNVITSIGGNNFIRQYLDINSDIYLSALLEYNLKFGGEKKQNKLALGYNSNASLMQSSYRFVIPTNVFAPNKFTVPTNQVDSQINEYISQNAINFRESSNSTYKAKLKEINNSVYANLFMKFADKWEINGGVRIENAQRETKYRTQGSFDEPFKKINRNKIYFLPSLNLKYKLSEKANMRLAASKTYTRPVIMEAYPIEYINADGTSERGNPLLVNSDNTNFDFKYELFPSAKEIFVVGVFAKNIINPIERTFRANAANSTITTYLNSDKANLYGAEIEFLFDFERLSSSLKDFSFGVNTSLMQTSVVVKPFVSEIDEDGNENISKSIETHQSRNLQGASNWLVNADVKYNFNINKNWSNTISLVGSVFGKRIFAVGNGGLDHVYELPVPQLDFILTSKLSQHYDFKFGSINILNPTVQFEMGNGGSSPIIVPSNIIKNFKKGVGFSMSLSYTF